jgi:PAS domain S-box-containing protein
VPRRTSSSPLSPGRQKRAKKAVGDKRLGNLARRASNDSSKEHSFSRDEHNSKKTELGTKKDQLEGSRLSHHDFCENTPVGCLIFDNKGIVLNMNLSAARVLGIERSLLLKKPFFLLVAPNSLDVFARHRRRVLTSGGTERCELALKTNEGGERLFQLQSIASANGSATILSILTDIAEQGRAEEALQVSRLHLSEAMDIAHLVYWERDPLAEHFVFNDPFYAFYGTTAEREGGYIMEGEEYARRFMHPDDAHLLREAVEKRNSANGREFVDDIEHRFSTLSLQRAAISSRRWRRSA